MLKKGICGAGIAGFAVLCLMMNASGNILYMTSFDNDGGELPNWTITTDDQHVGSVTAQSDVVFSTHKSMYVTSPKDRAVKAWATSPGLPAGYGNSPYVLETYIYLPDTNNHWFYVMCNGQIRSVIDTDNKLVYRHDYINEKLMTMNTGTWYRLFYDVHTKGDDKVTTPHVHIKVAAGGSSWNFGPFNLYQNTFWTNLYFGDDESTTANYGTAYFDDIRVNDNIFFADFNSADRIGWNWEFTSGDYAKIYISAKQATGDTGDYSLLIDSTCMKNAVAWAFTPTYGIDLTKSYTVSMNLYVPKHAQHNFYLPYNGHIKCLLELENVDNVNLKWFSGGSATKVVTFELYKWYYLRFDVRPADQKYDIYIGYCNDNVGPVKKATANFNDKGAINFLAIGDDYLPSHWGTVVLDNIRVEGTPK